MIGNRLRGVLANLVVAALLVGPTGQLSADDLLEAVLKCKQKKVAAKTSSGQVFLRSYPYNFEQIAIPFEGQGLLGVILQKELLAQGVLSTRHKPSEVIKNRFFGGTVQANESAMLMHVRGTQVTVFPRAMLVHPIVAGAKLNPQDTVVSMTCKLESFSKASVKAGSSLNTLKQLNESDPIHKWFHSTFFPQPSGAASAQSAVECRGELLPSSLRGRKVLEGQTSLSKLLDVELNLDSEIDTAKVGNAFVVATLRRQVGIWSLNFVTPLQHAGAFQYNSPYYSKVFEVPNPPEIGSWDPSLETFLGFVLLDGDIVEVSYHISVPLFQVQASVIPVDP